MFYKPTENPLSRMPLIEVRSDLILDALDEMDYDAVNIGWLDPLLPAGTLRGFDGRTSFPFLGANTYDAEGARPFAPWVVREYDGFTVGIFGLVSRQVPAVPGTPKPSFVIGDPVAAAREAVAALREQSDIIVGLTSLGIAADSDLARQVPGIDVILGGLDRRVVYQAHVESGTVIVQAGSKGMRLGRLDLEFQDGAGGWKQKQGTANGRTFTWTVFPLGAAVPDNLLVAKMLEEYRATLKEQRIALKLSPPSGRVSPYSGGAVCRRCHDGEYIDWLRTPHAGAFQTLTANNQDGNPDCLRCHVTAYGNQGGYSPGGTPDLSAVQCEACHGPGRRHPAQPESGAFINSKVPEPVCRRCHNPENSPGFEYETYLRRLSPHTENYFKRN